MRHGKQYEEHILRALNEGLPVKYIADYCGVTPSAMQAYINRHFVKRWERKNA